MKRLARDAALARAFSNLAFRMQIYTTEREKRDNKRPKEKRTKLVYRNTNRSRFARDLSFGGGKSILAGFIASRPLKGRARCFLSLSLEMARVLSPVATAAVRMFMYLVELPRTHLLRYSRHNDVEPPRGRV